VQNFPLQTRCGNTFKLPIHLQCARSPPKLLLNKWGDRQWSQPTQLAWIVWWKHCTSWLTRFGVGEANRQGTNETPNGVAIVKFWATKSRNVENANNNAWNNSSGNSRNASRQTDGLRASLSTIQLINAIKIQDTRSELNNKPQKFFSLPHSCHIRWKVTSRNQFHDRYERYTQSQPHQGKSLRPDTPILRENKLYIVNITKGHIMTLGFVQVLMGQSDNFLFPKEGILEIEKESSWIRIVYRFLNMKGKNT